MMTSACQRRKICSPNFFIRLLCGVAMGFLVGTKHLCNRNSQSNISEGQNPPLHGDVQQTDAERKIDDGREGFLYVGVMTAAKYVPTRCKAIMDTWGNNVPGKVEFFVGEDGFGVAKELDVVRLKKVDDNAYPPQKKSFMMLKYMYDKYLNGYEWFMRADDDVYIKLDKLEEFLRKLNSSDVIFIGQTGLGLVDEFGKLSLGPTENYCMGGPGMIFSREVFRRMVPNIGKCIRNMYTNHEDVEVSRCVSKYGDGSCVWSYETRNLFFEHYATTLGFINPYSGESFGNNLMDAITLHPNKKPEYHRVLHNFFLTKKVKVLQTKLSKLYRHVVEADIALDRTSEMKDFMLGSPLTLNRFRPTNGNDVQTWDFFADGVLATPGDNQYRGVPFHTQAAVKDMVLQVMHMINNDAETSGVVTSLRKVNYGFVRTNPPFGCDYVFDLSVIYNRYHDDDSDEVSLPVARHAYLQQTFARAELHEDPATDLVQVIPNGNPSFQPDAFAGKYIRKPFELFQTLFGFGKTIRKNMPFDVRKGDSHNPDKPDSTLYHLDSQFSRIAAPTVHLIVPLSGRFLTFERFMLNLEKIAFIRGDPISVMIMLSMPNNLNETQDMRLTQQLLKDYKTRYPSYDIRFLPVFGEFSRGRALKVGASQFSEDSLLFFCDIDVIFNSNFLHKCRSNTVRGKTVYYPVPFSEFDPNFGKNENAAQRENEGRYEIAKDVGYWREIGYDLLTVYQSDFVSTGGFNTSIKDWGLEDVDLFEKFVQPGTEQGSEKPTNPVTAKPMRVHEPDLIHVYHQSHCSPDLDSKQLHMCQSSKASGMMSVSRLYQKWRKHVGETNL